MDETSNSKPTGKIIGVAALVGVVTAVVAYCFQLYVLKSVHPAITGGAAAGAAAVVAATWGRKSA